jgi:endo-1,4-beta-xylanase
MTLQWARVLFQRYSKVISSFVVLSFAIAVNITGSAIAQSPVPILPIETVKNVAGYKGDNDRIETISIADAKLPFKRAFRVSRTSVGENSYSADMLWSSTFAVKKDDLLTATLYLRNTTPKRGALNLDITFQLSAEPYTPTLSSSAPVDGLEWRKYTIPFRSVQDYPAGKASFQIRYGLAIQQFEVGGVEILNYGKVADPIPQSISDRFAYYYPGRGEKNAPWRTEALARINKFRKGEMTIRAVDALGKALPGATIKIEQTKSAFVWSTAASAISMVCKVDEGDGERPCPSEDQLNERAIIPDDYRKLRERLLQDFNAVSFYNDLKWTEWYNEKQLALEGIDWLNRNRMPLSRGHNLIWPSFEPDYMMPKEIINRSTPAAKMKQVIAEHFADVLGALRGQVPEWDVVNEPFSNTDIQGRLATPNAKAIRGVLTPEAVVKWFKDARKADPNAVLFLNDYGILESLNPVQQSYDLALVKYIQSLSAPVDGIGFQGHFGMSGPMFSDMQRVINEFSPLVKTFSLTEFDFTTIDPKMQANLMEDMMIFVYSQRKFNLFQMWGFWDGDHWLGNAPLYNRDWSLKPSGEVWQRLTKKTWRTNGNGFTDDKGVFKLNAFYGDYNIIVSVAGKTCITQLNFKIPREIIVQGNC